MGGSRGSVLPACKLQKLPEAEEVLGMGAGGKALLCSAPTFQCCWMCHEPSRGFPRVKRKGRGAQGAAIHQNGLAPHLGSLLTPLKSEC